MGTHDCEETGELQDCTLWEKRILFLACIVCWALTIRKDGVPGAMNAAGRVYHEVVQCPRRAYQGQVNVVSDCDRSLVKNIGGQCSSGNASRRCRWRADSSRTGGDWLSKRGEDG
jgi:hypothetical protein